MIDKSKQYKTRDGREVRIYATDGKGPSSMVHGAVNVGDGWVSYSWDANGVYLHSNNRTDLIEVKPRIKRTVWVNVYSSGCGRPCESKEEADCTPGAVLGFRIACVRLTIDCEEGEGL